MGDERFRQPGGIERHAGLERAAGRAQGSGRGGSCIEGIAAANHCAGIRSGENFQNGKPFRGRLRIGDCSFPGFRGWLGQHQCVDPPQLHLGGQSLAVTRVVANDPCAWPAAVTSGLANRGNDQAMRGLRNVIEHDAAVTISQTGQACGEIRVGGGTVQPAACGIVLVGHATAIGTISDRRKPAAARALGLVAYQVHHTW